MAISTERMSRFEEIARDLERLREELENPNVRLSAEDLDRLGSQLDKLKLERNQMLAEADAEINRLESDLGRMLLAGDMLLHFACANKAKSADRMHVHEKLHKMGARYNYGWGLGPAERLRRLAARGTEIAERFPPGEDADAFFENPKRTEAVDYQKRDDRDHDSKVLRAISDNMHLVGRWALAGHNVLAPSAGLAAKLTLTDGPEGGDPPMLPFDAFAVALPPRAVPFLAGDSAEWADSIWIHRLTLGGVRHVQLAVGWRGLALFDRIREERLSAEADPGDGVLPDDRASIAAGWHLARNLVLWINAGGGIRKAGERERVPPKLAEKRRRGGESWPARWEFGKRIVVSRELQRAAEESALGRSRHGAAGWRVRAQFVVRGHWRNQACGEGRADRRRIFVEPFWKNKDAAKAWAHVYVDER